MDDYLVIEVMAVAICNAIRKDHNLPPLKNMGDVENPDSYRRQARQALIAYRQVALGR